MDELLELIAGFDKLNSNSAFEGFVDFDNSSYDGRTSTLIVTDECNLRCSYCYVPKQPKKMTWQTAKQYLDYIFEKNHDLYKIPISDQGILEHRKIFEFIGGEPLLEADLVFTCMEYITSKIRELPDNHPWKRTDWRCHCGKPHSAGYRMMLSTNGLLLNDPLIQKELLKYSADYLYIGVTLDGHKEMHDLCRRTVDGKGSYDEVVKAWSWLKRHYPSTTLSTKSTISHDNLIYVSEIIKFFYEFGIKNLAQNCVYENVWHRGDDLVLYDQLCDAADYMITHQRWRNMSVRWFSPFVFSKSTSPNKWCGAGTYMDAADWQGKIYPCLRFKTLVNKDPFVMGNINDGLDEKAVCELNAGNLVFSDEQKKLVGTDCVNCPVSALCSDCQAHAYDCFGSFRVKSPYICPMHKAVVCANIYFFSKLLDVPINRVYIMSLLDDWTKNDYFLE